MKGQGVDEMKRCVARVLVVLLIGLLFACSQTTTQQSEWVVLPDLSGMSEQEVVNYLQDLPINYQIEYVTEQNKQYDNKFIMYNNHSIGDIISENENIVILFYPHYIPETNVIIPNLHGMTFEYAVKYLNENDYLFITQTTPTDNLELDGLFAYYQEGIDSGDYFNNASAFEVYFYKYVPTNLPYYEAEDIPYDGPYLDEIYFTKDALNPRGGAFIVSLQYCTDGDTARFVYPTEIYNAINSTAKSTRFLNIDTEETYSGGEEEWGKPASVYTCDLLTSAKSIALQTDPGDGLLDTHGRLLAWVWIQLYDNDSYQLLNYMVVRQGLAQVKYEFGAGLDLSYNNTTYNEWMHTAENKAIEEERAQWGDYIDYYWNYETDSPYWERWD